MKLIQLILEGDEVDTSLDPLEDKKEIIRQVAKLIKKSMPVGNEQIKAFIKTHYNDIINLGDDEAILDEFQEFLSVNYPLASDFTNQERPSGSDLLDLQILIQQVVGVKTLEDALEVIKRYESKDFKGSPVSPEEAKELIAGLKAKEEDKDDRKITNLMAKAFSIKLGEILAAENFKDGKKKGKSRPGRVKKSGASCKGSVSSLRAKAKKYGGEKGKMYHWCANMKGGKKK